MADQSELRLSQHPVDRFIRELVRTGRPATMDEVERIIGRVAVAPFESKPIRVRVDDRGETYQGYTLGARADSATYHLIKRVAIENQWAVGTTFASYLDDIRRAARDSRARVAVYAARNDHFVVTVTATERVLRPEQLGFRPLPLFVVIYSADSAIIKSGYLISALDRANIPEAARWLK